MCKQLFSFEKLKLTNNELDQNSHVSLVMNCLQTEDYLINVRDFLFRPLVALNNFRLTFVTRSLKVIKKKLHSF